MDKEQILDELYLELRLLKVDNISKEKLEQNWDFDNRSFYLPIYELSVLPVSSLSKMKLLKLKFHWGEGFQPGLVSQLITIKELDLSESDFRSFPKEILQLKNLEILRMDNCFLKSVGQEIKELEKLRIFHANGGDEGGMVEEIHEDLCNLINLEELHLKANRINTIPVAIEKLKNLKVLDLSNNELLEIPEEIGNLNELRILRMRHIENYEYPYSNSKLKFLPSSLTKLRNLKELTYPLLYDIEDVFTTINTLLNLKLVQNNKEILKGVLIDELDLLGYDPHFHGIDIFDTDSNTLNLPYTNKFPLGGLEIYDDIKNVEVTFEPGRNTDLIIKLLPSLIRFQSITSFKIIADGCQGFNNLLVLKNLQRLDITGFLPEFRVISKIKSLREIIITNWSDENTQEENYEEIDMLVNLESLEVFGFPFILPNSIINLPKLNKLVLRIEAVSELVPLKDIILGISSLEYLELEGYDLRFENPEKIYSLSNLKKLTLIYCGGVNEIIENIGYLENLTHLEIDACEITSIPSSFSRLRKLKKLILNGNHITKVNCDFTQLSKLKELELASNRMNEIPSEIGNLVDLERLIINGNPISRLPVSLRNLTKLETFAVYDFNSKNPYEDLKTIYDIGGNISLKDELIILGCKDFGRSRFNVETATLYNNKDHKSRKSTLFIKNLPVPIYYAIKWQIRSIVLINPPSTLDLSRLSLIENLEYLELRGNIPDEVYETDFPPQIKYLKINNTRLTKVSKSLGKVLSLEKLDLDSNMINEFPEAILELSNLYFIDLSNNLIETIPQILRTDNMGKFIDLKNNPLVLHSKIPSDLSYMQREFGNAPGLSIQITIEKLFESKDSRFLDHALLYSTPSFKTIYQIAKRDYEITNNLHLIYSNIRYSPEAKRYSYNIANNVEIPVNELSALNLESLSFTAYDSENHDWIYMDPFEQKLYRDKIRNSGISRNKNIFQIPDTLFSLATLKSLSFSRINIRINWTLLPYLCRLKSLDLPDSNFITKLPPEIQQLQNLEVLSFSKTGIRELPDWLFEMRNLTHISAVGAKIEMIDDRLYKLKNLKYLNLEQNNITAFDIDISRFEFLEEILLEGNPLEKELSESKTS